MVTLTAKKAVAAPAAKPKAPAKPKITYGASVRGPHQPAWVYGVVTDLGADIGYRIDIKKPRSSKYDSFVVPTADVMLVATGDLGYIVTENPELVAYSPGALNTFLTDAVVTDDTIEGTDRDGQQVSINRKLLPCSVSLVPIDAAA